MNKVFIIFLFLGNFIGKLAMSQDLVVYNEGDSLNCKIINQDLNSIHFSYTEDNELVTRELPKSLFKSIIVGFYLPGDKKTIVSDSAKIDTTHTQTGIFSPTPNDTISVMNQAAPDSLDADKTIALKDSVQVDTSVLSKQAAQISQPPPVTEAIAISRWYAGIRGGYANRLFRMRINFTEAYKAYQKELKSGYAVGAHAGYFLWKNVGLGVTGELYKSTARMKDDSRNDAISINYLGGSVVHRKVMQSQKSTVSTGFTVGYQTYVNQGEDLIETFVLRGKAIGWGFNTGLDYRISPKAAVTFSASCLFGTMYKLTKESGSRKQTVKLNKDSFEDLSRISLTVGLKFF